MGQAYWGIWGKYPSQPKYNGVPDFEAHYKPTAICNYVPRIKALLLDTSLHTWCEFWSEFNKIRLNAADVYDTSWQGQIRGHLTAEEVRLEANMAAAWGAKGYNVTNMGTNGLREIGITTENFRHDMDGWDSSVSIKHIPGNQLLDLSDSANYYYVRPRPSGTWLYSLDGNKDTTLYEYIYTDGTHLTKGKFFNRHSELEPWDGNCFGGWFEFNNYSHRLKGANLWMKTFYGFHSLYEGTKRGMSDLNRAGEILSKLTWEDAYDASKSDSVGPKMPITSLISIKQIPTVLDSLDQPSRAFLDSLDNHGKPVIDDREDMLIEVGAFTNARDPHARYVYVVNRHVWPNRVKNDPFTPDSVLGNAGVRRVAFKIRPEAFGADSDITLWTISNIAENRKSLDLTPGSFYYMLLEPGEGKLIKIAPGIGLETGKMTTNLFNNAKHIAVNEKVGGGPIQHYMVYEREGDIQFAHPKEVDRYFERRENGTPADTTIDNGGKCHNPAIALSVDSNGGIGVVYSIDRAGVNHDSTFIIFRHSNLSTPYAFSAPAVMDKFRTSDPYFFAAPAISPATLNPFGQFWVSWRHPSLGGSITITDTLGTKLTTKRFYASDPTLTKFVSIGSHQMAPYFNGSFKDTCYIAFEERAYLSQHHIFFTRAWLDPMNPGTILTATPLNISRHDGLCEHHFPAINALSGDQAVVTYEAMGFKFGTLPRDRYVVERYTTRPSNTWSNYTRFLALSKVQKDTIHVYPDVSRGYLSHPGNPTLWDDFERLTWEDSLNNMVHIAHRGTGFPWETVHMVESSLEASLPVHNIGSHGALKALMYRSPTASDGIGSGAHITRYDFPWTPTITSPTLIETFTIKFADECIHFHARGGEIENASPAGPSTKIAWIPVDSNTVDTVNMPAPVEWGNPTVRSEVFTIHAHDTLKYQRYFRVGSYEAGDTAAFAHALASNDFVAARLRLKRASNNTTLIVLDTARLNADSTFVQSASVSDSGHDSFVYAGPDSLDVYVSFEVERGDPDDGLEMGHSEDYLDQIQDYLPAPEEEESEKISTGRHPQAAGSTSALKFSIIPNPFDQQTHVNITTTPESKVRVTVHDVLGRTLLQLFDDYSKSGQENLLIEGSKLGRGSYFVRVQSGNEVASRRLEVVR